MRVLFIFLDGVGLGPDDPATNPFARAAMPHLQALLGGRRLLAGAAPHEGPRLSLLPLDARLGVGGLPQSATGQAALLTGRNVPAALGYHYGPKPDPATAVHLRDGTLFNTLIQRGKRVALLNAYPPRYFQAIQSGRRLYSAIPLAATSAGLRLKTSADLKAGQALSADLTGHGWKEHLGLPDAPEYSPFEAGVKLAELARDYDFSFFEYWLTDYAGHHQDFDEALAVLAALDGMLGGLAQAWEDDRGVALVTSDHGNLEDLGTRRHTAHPVPALLLGAAELRRLFSAGLHDLTGVAPAILRMLITAQP
jgi:2,3-bisphosphoglycerate-independent phosphoglycerate mutase